MFISFCRLTGTDVVRHRLVGRIVEAYEVFDADNHAAGLADRQSDKRVDGHERRPRTGPQKTERGPR